MRPEKIRQPVQKVERKWKGIYCGGTVVSQKDRTGGPGIQKRSDSRPWQHGVVVSDAP